MSTISKFVIHKLYGDSNNIELIFRDNTLILVGENGAGKTTVLKMLFYTLSGQWQKLAMYNFVQITVTINQRVYIINHEDIKLNYDSIKEKVLRRMPPSMRREFFQISESNKNLDIKEIEILCRNYGYPIDAFIHELNSYSNVSKKNQTKLADIEKALQDTHILYLPTYRRIEEELGTIFRGIDESSLVNKNRRYSEYEKCNYTELIEFGMKDVERAISFSLDYLKDFARESLNNLTLGYLGDVVDKKYTQIDISQISNVSEETMNNILKRIDSKILSEESKKHLFQTIDNIKREGSDSLSEHDKVICHYFIKLLNFQQDLENKEEKINRFSEVCNKYMISKTFQYDTASFNFSILSKNAEKNEIQLNQLSSGEKQIVSLFSHLYLSNNNNYFVLIDEPELSLSVKWQREFLVDIKNGGFCKGLIAVTHSPFIFENELDEYAYGLGEFYKVL